MPTKAELEDELEAAQRTISALKGQITRLKNEAADDAPASGDLVTAVRGLLDNIDAKGLNTQAGQDHIQNILDAL